MDELLYIYYHYSVYQRFDGRTYAGFLGKKVEAREMKNRYDCSSCFIRLSFLVIYSTFKFIFMCITLIFVESEGGWLNNLGFHGLSEQLYEYTSCAANNGSGFEGLGDNTYFWNYTCGIVLILSRFYSYHRAGCHCRITGTEEIHSIKGQRILDLVGGCSWQRCRR